MDALTYPDRRESGEGARLYAGRGSSVLTGWTDTQLHLSHRATPKGAGKIAFEVETVKARDGERGGRVVVSIVLGTGELEFEELGERDELPIGPDVVAVLRKAMEPMSGEAIRKLLKRRKDDVNKALRELAADGTVLRTGDGWQLAGRTAVKP